MGPDVLFDKYGLPGLAVGGILEVLRRLKRIETMQLNLSRRVAVLERARHVAAALLALLTLGALSACSTASGVGGAAVGTVGGVLCTVGRGVGAATAALCGNANDPVVTSRAAMATTARAASSPNVMILEAPDDAAPERAPIVVRARSHAKVVVTDPTLADGSDVPTEEVCPPCGCATSPPPK